MRCHLMSSQGRRLLLLFINFHLQLAKLHFQGCGQFVPFSMRVDTFEHSWAIHSPQTSQIQILEEQFPRDRTLDRDEMSPPPPALPIHLNKLEYCQERGKFFKFIIWEESVK